MVLGLLFWLGPFTRFFIGGRGDMSMESMNLVHYSVWPLANKSQIMSIKHLPQLMV